MEAREHMNLELASIVVLAGCTALGCSPEISQDPPSACADGACPVLKIAASPATSIGAIVVDRDRVYWTEFYEGRVMMAPVDGGEASVVASAQDEPTGLAVRDGQAVWSTRTSLMMMPVDSSVPPVELAKEGTYFSDVVIAGQLIYWGVGNADGDPGEIRRIPRQGGAIETLVAGNAPGNIAVAGDEVFWESLTDLGKAPITGGVADILFSNPDGIDAIALGPDAVYWSSPQGLMTGPKAGGQARLLAPGEETVSLVTDGKSLYWAAFKTGALMKVAVDGGAPVVLTPGPLGAALITIDDEWVYWVDQVEHVVKKVRK
jgi:hypothetical protein